MERVNLKNFDFEGFGHALAATELNRTEQLKLFAAVFNHNARALDDLKRAPQVRAATRDTASSSQRRYSAGSWFSMIVAEVRRTELSQDGNTTGNVVSPSAGREIERDT